MKSMSSLLLKFLSNWAERIVDLFYIDGTAVLVKSFGCNRSHTLAALSRIKIVLKDLLIFKNAWGTSWLTECLESLAAFVSAVGSRDTCT